MRATFATGRISPAVTADQRLWLDLESAGLDWRAYTGKRRIPRWRLRVNAWYSSIRAEVLHEKRP